MLIIITDLIAKESPVELETAAIQVSLLLRCGDVESNPGPLSREGKNQLIFAVDIMSMSEPIESIYS